MKVSERGNSMQRGWLSLVIMAILVFVVAGGAIADEVYLRVAYVKKGPKIDGLLDDEAWKIAEQKGGKGILEWHLHGKPATYKSDLFICFDADNLYIAYKNYQKKDTVVATFTTDGSPSWTMDDDIGTFISTTYPASTWMQALSNPNSIRTTYGMGSNDSWDVACVIYDDYWVVEQCLPFDNFNIWPEAGDEWAGNFTRHIGANTGAGDTEWLSWSPLVKATFLDATTMCLLEFVK